MRAVVVNAPGGFESLVVAQVPDPVPQPGEVVVEIAAAGVNRADLLQRAGHYPPPPGAPAWPGLEVSGVVVALGPDVAPPDGGGWRVGQQVAALLAGGGYAERVAVPAGQLLPVPASVSLVDAAALPEAVCTAWTNLVDTGGLRAGQTVLVQGGSGGVGSVAVQLAAALGARVITTAGSAERRSRPADAVYGRLVQQRSELGKLDALGLLDNDGDLVLGLLCQLSDQCLFPWRAA